MLTLLLLATCSFIFLYELYKYAISRPVGFPPGPPRIPIFGSYLFMLLINYKYLHKAAITLSKWYKSDIIGLYVGNFAVAVVNSGEAVRQILNNQVYDGRPSIYLAEMRDPGKCVRGPPRLPIFGSYLFMLLINYKYLHKAAIALSKWYKSDIIGLYVGPFAVAVVNSGEAVRQILNNQDYDGRPSLYLAEMRDPGKCIRGIFFQEGVLWKEQRRFILRYLRDFGFGRRFEQLELIIQEEITDMLDLIRNGPRYEHEHLLVKPGGYRVQLPLFFNPFSANSHFQIVYNERLPRPEMAKLVKLVQFGLQFQRNADDYGRMLSIIPWIRFIWPETSGYNKLKESNLFVHKYFAEFIDRYINTYEDGCERNFLDLYIAEMRKGLPEQYGFNREQFIMGLVDFSFPAFTAVGVQISLLVQYLMLYPDVAKRIQSEIDEVVGGGRLPTLEDRKNMPFTEATIRENLRIETLVPSDVPHKSLVDTELMGYHIPKDTIIIPSLYALHTDKRIWSDPENFRPERFLDADGKLSLKLDVSLPFGAGKRICAGETFARNMIFLVTTAMLQNFDYTLAPGDSLPDLTKNNNGLIITPADFWVQLKERQH
ncbi:GH18361 [Drosophila grimshawi]|uniref:GH18361 n=1 Tax=Drosophila grimshawi TaxID=7222 RepID=B4JEX9_DROGR|nr:GH18361 [Drosophila grimshawi]